MNKDLTNEEILAHLKECCEQIGFRLRHGGCEHYQIINDEDRKTGWVYWERELRYTGLKYQNFTSYLNLKTKDTIRVLDNDTLALGSEKGFVLLHNKHFGQLYKKGKTK